MSKKLLTAVTVFAVFICSVCMSWAATTNTLEGPDEVPVGSQIALSYTNNGDYYYFSQRPTQSASSTNVSVATVKTVNGTYSQNNKHFYSYCSVVTGKKEGTVVVSGMLFKTIKVVPALSKEVRLGETYTFSDNIPCARKYLHKVTVNSTDIGVCSTSLTDTGFDFTITPEKYGDVTCKVSHITAMRTNDIIASEEYLTYTFNVRPFDIKGFAGNDFDYSLPFTDEYQYFSAETEGDFLTVNNDFAVDENHNLNFTGTFNNPGKGKVRIYGHSGEEKTLIAEIDAYALEAPAVTDETGNPVTDIELSEDNPTVNL
ncbi:MAG: hypothetical protein KBT47_03905, partial [Armatimonadetes bacterium]|nr:hypothetical protein [Candidatus Hippobium faecium]